MRSVHGWEFDGVPDEENRLRESQQMLNIVEPVCESTARLTVLLKTQSKFPSSVYSFMAQPWTSRAVSAEPRSGPTVDIRRRTSVFFPTVLRKLADVMSEQSWVTSNSPNALCWGRAVNLLASC